MPLDNETRELAKDLVKFIQAELDLKSIPKISFRFDHENAKKHLAVTGHFEEGADSVVVYAADRHPKDILRSLAHEMYHHYQKEKGELGGDKTKGTEDPNYVVHDDYLRKIEQDAFGYGNIIFRKWEASKKGDGQMEKKPEQKTEKEVEVNEAILNSNTYIPEDRAMSDAYNARDEKVYNELLRKFGIKK
jgi:hypothetical protein